MKEYITIKGFGPLKNIENLEIKPFTVLIGESASGKSILMKVVAMMRYIYKMSNIRSYLYRSKITKSPFRFSLDTMMKRLCKPCGKEFIDKFSEKILIFGRRNRDINTNTALTLGDVKGNMLAFLITPVNLSKYTTTEEILNGEMVSFIIVNYPNPHIW